MDSFNVQASQIAQQPAKARNDSPASHRERGAVSVAPKDIVFPYRKPAKPKKLDYTAPILRPRPESELPPKEAVKLQKRAFSPGKEGVGNVAEVRAGSKVLAGRPLFCVQKEDSRMRSLMDALEQRLNRILGTARHRTNLSVS